MPKPTKKKSGRPSSFKEEYNKGLEELYRRGFTDNQIVTILKSFSGVGCEKTINTWKLKNAKFLQSLKDWKSAADLKVEKSLYERACGFEHPEEKVQLDRDGKWQRTMVTKKYAPDTTAIIFWLKNRKPEEWRDRAELELTGQGKSIIDRIRKEMNSPNEEKDDGEDQEGIAAD
jgi:hypothetical protein